MYLGVENAVAVAALPMPVNWESANVASRTPVDDPRYRLDLIFIVGFGDRGALLRRTKVMGGCQEMRQRSHGAVYKVASYQWMVGVSAEGGARAGERRRDGASSGGRREQWRERGRGAW